MAKKPDAGPPLDLPLEEEFQGAELEFIRWFDSPNPNDFGRPIGLYRWTQATAIKYLRLVRSGASSYQTAAAIGADRKSFYRWRDRGRAVRGKTRKNRLCRLFFLATQQAEGHAVADCEATVKITNPLAWLARRARSHPGYVGWEPESVKLDLGGQADNPIELHRQISEEEIRTEETSRLGAAIGVLHQLGLLTEQNLTGAVGSRGPNDDDELDPDAESDGEA